LLLLPVMRSSPALAPLLLTLAAFVATPANAILIRHDRDDAAARELGAKFPAVGRVQPDGAGTLIAPQWVLTAGHVARTIRSDPPAFRVGDRDRPIRRVFLPPGWTEGPGDIALIELVDPVTEITPIPLFRGRDEAGRIVTIVGDGDPGDGRSGPRRNDGIRRAATNRVARVDADWIVVTFDPPGAATDLEGISGPGDSGGPALLKVGDDYQVAGVSVWGSEGPDRRDGHPGTYGDLDGFTRVSTFLQWIDDTLAGKSQPHTSPKRSLAAGDQATRRP